MRSSSWRTDFVLRLLATFAVLVYSTGAVAQPGPYLIHGTWAGYSSSGDVVELSVVESDPVQIGLWITSSTTGLSTESLFLTRFMWLDFASAELQLDGWGMGRFDLINDSAMLLELPGGLAVVLSRRDLGELTPAEPSSMPTGGDPTSRPTSNLSRLPGHWSGSLEGLALQMTFLITETGMLEATIDAMAESTVVVLEVLDETENTIQVRAVMDGSISTIEFVAPDHIRLFEGSNSIDLYRR